MHTLFGTDGIRGCANKYPMDCETVIRIGRAISIFFGDRDVSNKILIGCDTRNSNYMLVNAISAGICSMGVDVVFAGVLPTPAVAYLTLTENYCAGVVISASHNKFYDNGIKLFDSDGLKLDNLAESELEKLILSFDIRSKNFEIKYLGQFSFYKNSLEEYNGSFEGKQLDSEPIKDMKIVIDCSNGATSICAPMIFTKLGANVTSIFCSPNGININDGCGSEHPKILANKVLENNADIGLAFDGDGDRVTVVSELGKILTGDHLLAIFAKDFKQRNLLNNNVVISTFMSNFGLTVFLEKIDVKHIKSKIGDKNVIEKMLDTGAVLGGENSGHIIFNKHKNIGDGIFTGLELIKIIKKSSLSLSKLSNQIKMIPQYTLNVDVITKPDLYSIPVIKNTISMVETKLKNKGRLLVRYSGTEAKCRIMVEGNNMKKIKKYCNYVKTAIFECIGR